jgi:PhnB protein
MQIQPYLFFEGRTEEALEFYQSKLGAKVEFMMRYKENPIRSTTRPTPARR